MAAKIFGLCSATPMDCCDLRGGAAHVWSHVQRVRACASRVGRERWSRCTSISKKTKATCGGVVCESFSRSGDRRRRRTAVYVHGWDSPRRFLVRIRSKIIDKSSSDEGLGLALENKPRCGAPDFLVCFTRGSSLTCARHGVNVASGNGNLALIGSGLHFESEMVIAAVSSYTIGNYDSRLAVMTSTAQARVLLATA